jgi:threonine/homoserine/homoserine lactone efflux protein
LPAQLFPFLAVMLVLTAVPGPDMALVLRNGLRGGTSVAWWTGLGCCTGIATYAAASAAGLAAVLAASATAFEIVKLVGAAYLVYLGIVAWWHTRRVPPERDPEPDRPPAGPGRAAAYRQGLVGNLLNPKIALIFLTIIPQFVSKGEPAFSTISELAGAFLVMAVVWWRIFSLAVGSLGRILSRASVRRWVEAVTGTVLIGLGIRVALTRS